MNKIEFTSLCSLQWWNKNLYTSATVGVYKIAQIIVEYEYLVQQQEFYIMYKNVRSTATMMLNAMLPSDKDEQDMVASGSWILPCWAVITFLCITLFHNNYCWPLHSVFIGCSCLHTWPSNSVNCSHKSLRSLYLSSICNL